MKIKILLIVAILSLVLTGCSSNEEISLVDEGKAMLEKHEYTKAKELFAEALEIDSDDEHARAMYVQATKMLNALEFEKQQNYKKAINELEIIEKIKSGSSEVKNEAARKKKELEKMQAEYEEAQEQRKLNAKNVSSKDTYRTEAQALKENEKKQEAEKKKEEEEKKKEEENNQNQNQNNGNNQQQGGTVIPPQENQQQGSSTPPPQVNQPAESSVVQ